MRLVLDTCILVSAFRSRNGASRRLLNLLAERKFQLIVTPALFFEYEDVLGRSSQLLTHGYSREQIGVFIQALTAYAILIPRIPYQVKPVLPDPNDELVLEAAINGYADAIITFNLSDFLPMTSQFGIAVQTPRSILELRLSQ